MGAQFFNYMSVISENLTVNRMRHAEWIMEHNPLLVEGFVLFFRFILSKLEVEDARDYLK